MSTGGPIRLKAHPGPERPQRKFDILTSAGKVQPKALDPDSYEWPNGASIRPNGAGQQRIVHSYTGPNISIYSIPAGVPLPSDLIIVHEFGDHYSLQPRREMTVEGNTKHGLRYKGWWLTSGEALETKINAFLHARGRRYSKEEWLRRDESLVRRDMSRDAGSVY
ncbi:hypothetical protein N7488_002040 [Penicillium malachiteum]|nr:hypothetical protein N7488_002040 [Penicillium malachiteum]